MIQIFSIVGSLAKTFLQNKAREVEAKQELKIKTIESTDSWEQLQAQASQTSWKDTNDMRGHPRPRSVHRERL